MYMTLKEFLKLPWSDNVRQKLRDMEKKNGALRYLVAWDNAGKLAVSAYTAKPDSWPDNAKGIWSRQSGASCTMQALDLVNEGLTPYAAAKQVGINQSAVYRAIARRAGREVCESCGQVIKSQAAD